MSASVWYSVGTGTLPTRSSALVAVEQSTETAMPLAFRTRRTSSATTLVFPVCLGALSTTEFPCVYTRSKSSLSTCSRPTRSSAPTAPPVGKSRRWTTDRLLPIGYGELCHILWQELPYRSRRSSRSPRQSSCTRSSRTRRRSTCSPCRCEPVRLDPPVGQQAGVVRRGSAVGSVTTRRGEAV